MDRRVNATDKRFLFLISGTVSFVIDVVLRGCSTIIKLIVIIAYIIKYEIHTVSLIIIAAINQAKWLIEENTRIFFILFWFNPPIAPTIAHEITIIAISGEGE